MTTTQPPRAEQTQVERPWADVDDHVRSRVGVLQAQYLADVPAAVAALARLRRAVTAEPGADPVVWPQTMEGLPTSLVGHGDDPSAGERAVHLAITTYAVHQQSRRGPMHVSGIGLGRAVRRLVAPDARDESPVWRRFLALATASTFEETTHHLRGMVTMLRARELALDYGRLAADLYLLQRPAAADRVRLRWGRDFQQPPRATDATADPSTAADDGGDTTTTTGDPT